MPDKYGNKTMEEINWCEEFRKLLENKSFDRVMAANMVQQLQYRNHQLLRQRNKYRRELRRVSRDFTAARNFARK